MQQDLAPISALAGVGLRAPHYRDILAQRPQLGWLEAHSENFFGADGQPHHYLSALRAEYAISLHGVGLSLGSVDPLNQRHLSKLRQLVDRYEPCFVSEHLSWSSINGRYLNDLLPLPYSEEALAHLSTRILQVQERLQRRILIENITAYVQFKQSVIPEAQFLSELAHRTGCGLLLDINNVYVNSINHGFDPQAFLQQIPAQAIEEIHLAGHERIGELLVDTHGTRVCETVWHLYQDTIQCIGARPTLIEWDNAIPPLATLLDEAQHAIAILEEANTCAA